MADIPDPLSITANITGILTFIAAIVAFIYVRYRILTNGYDEMVDILTSVVATVEDTAVMTEVVPAEWRDDRDGGGATSGSTLLENLILSLYSIEISIITECMKSLGHPDIADMLLAGPRPIALETTESPDIKWKDLEDVINNMLPTRRQKWSLLEILRDYRNALGVYLQPGSSFASLLWITLRFILHLGLTPTMTRWYKIRGQVLKKMQKRDAIRSRLLFHQVYAANALSRQHTDSFADARGDAHALSQDLANSIRDSIRGAHRELDAKLDHVNYIVTNLTNIVAQLVDDRNEAKERGNNASDLE